MTQTTKGKEDLSVSAVTCHPEWRPAPETIDPKDPFVNGFVSSTLNNGVKKLTPYDYLTDPETGLRFAGPFGVPGKPSGVNVVDLKNGIPAYASLPPLAIWKLGEWLLDIDEEDWPSATDHMTTEDLHLSYFTSGEGTNGNYLWRIYKCPLEVAGQIKPKHPLLWAKKLKEYKPPVYSEAHWKSAPVKPVVPAAPAAPALPAGVRFRCVGCGHWYKEADLKGHNMVCPTKQGGFNDWAIMCDPACGCKTLHEVAECKPGFPRAIEEKEVEVKAEATPVEAPPAPKDDDDGA